MLKLKEGSLEDALLQLSDAIAGVMEQQCGNSGLNWQDRFINNYFDTV